MPMSQSRGNCFLFVENPPSYMSIKCCSYNIDCTRGFLSSKILFNDISDFTADGIDIIDYSVMVQSPGP